MIFLSSNKSFNKVLLVLLTTGLISSCGSSYKHLQQASGSSDCIQLFRPAIKSAVIYNTQVNVVGNHLSGLMIMKQMPDSSFRIVFTSEAGLTFFDFEFAANDEFIVHSIIDKMNKKAVIKTLRKDFELILMKQLGQSKQRLLKSDSLTYHDFARGKDHFYYVTDSSCSKLLWMERGSKRKKILTAITAEFKEGVPDTIGITHNNFKFDIGLRRIQHAAP